MKRLVILALLLALTGCRSRTQYGECVGIADDPDPALVYKVSKRNVIVAVLFFETGIVPLVVLLTQTRCPVGRK